MAKKKRLWKALTEYILHIGASGTYYSFVVFANITFFVLNQLIVCPVPNMRTGHTSQENG
jgi:hypothetical protein